MDITNFFNRETTVDKCFKESPITIVIPYYSEHMKPLLRNILFRLETTNNVHNMFFIEHLNNKEEIATFQKELGGRFTTRILSSSEMITGYETESILFLIDSFAGKKCTNSPVSEIGVLNQLMDNLTFNNNAYTILTDYEGDSAYISLRQLHYSPFLKKYLLNNKYENNKNNELVLDNYPIVASKVFNIFNQIVTEGLTIYQTFEEINLSTMTSSVGFKFKEITRFDRYFLKEELFSYFLKRIDYNEIFDFEKEINENQGTSEFLVSNFVGDENKEKRLFFIRDYLLDMKLNLISFSSNIKSRLQILKNYGNRDFEDTMKILAEKEKELEQKEFVLENLISKVSNVEDPNLLSNEDFQEILNIGALLKA